MEVTLAFQLTINGDRHYVDGDTPLLRVLRDVLGMRRSLQQH
jgi:aerobic-type carbon monoxide dehydrogenase small subunit (CoxS/CutS family)